MFKMIKTRHELETWPEISSFSANLAEASFFSAKNSAEISSVSAINSAETRFIPRISAISSFSLF